MAVGSGAIWGIHLDLPELDFIGDGFISVGWDDIGDLREFGSDRDALKAQLAERIAAKPGAIPVWAGLLMRFAREMQPGDLVVYPRKADRTVNLGLVDSDYRWEADLPTHRHRRSIKWIQTGLPRTGFSQGALYEIGSAVTLFRVKTHAQEFLQAAHLDPQSAAAAPVAQPDVVVDEASLAEDVPDAERILDTTRDFILRTLATDLKGHPFAEFVSRLLRTMGYRTIVSPPGPDRGIDIVAHKDKLGLEPPIIKVQCKSTGGKIGSPEVSSLAGTLGGDELGLFVTLGHFSPDAVNMGRDRSRIRLIDGPELVNLILEHYDQLPAEDRARIPMRQVYVQDLSA
jgi:restriction system protein